MFGLNIDPNNPRGNPEPQELGNLGVELVRYTFYDSSGGDQIDPQKAQFYRDRAQAYKDAGIDSLVILTYDTYPNRPGTAAGQAEWDQYIERFARRAQQIAQLLAPIRPAFQVWNEPDHETRPDYAPTLREDVFGRMLQQTYSAIKFVDPNFTVVTAGLATGNPGWLTRVIHSLGGSLPADAVAFHPYGQRPEPNFPHANWFFGYVGDLLNNYYRAGLRKPLWITEMGIKEADVDNNRDTAAEFLRRFYRTITTRFSDKVEQTIWFCYSDGMVPPFGLVDAAGNRKPAYNAYREAVVEGRRRQPTPISRPAQPVPRPASPQPVLRPPALIPPPRPTTSPPTRPVPSITPSPPPLPVGSTTYPSTAPAPPPPQAGSGSAQPLQLTQQIEAIQTQVQQLQTQMAQLQQYIQQLVMQQAQMQRDIQTLESQLGSGAGAAPAPPIQNITAQLPHHPTKRYPTRPLDHIQRIIIHHTAISPAIGVERIADHRVNKQDWPGIGYHYFITAAGVIQQTNELTTVSKHAAQFNEISIGVCFAGDFTNTSPTPQQIEAGAQLIAWLLIQFRLPLEATMGHKEFVNTQSPGLQWDNGARWGDQLKARIRALM